TYGFPVDLTADVCRERNIKVDEAGFETKPNQPPMPSREELLARNSFGSVNDNKYLNRLLENKND
ncbi:DUF2737 family protein, partial [Salmonella enterica subsp. enterica serovar Cerro]|nr:DUF2737 family protein [Salmonella enterica subsp. enterica serovar Cerro]